MTEKDQTWTSILFGGVLGVISHILFVRLYRTNRSTGAINKNEQQPFKGEKEAGSKEGKEDREGGCVSSSTQRISRKELKHKLDQVRKEVIHLEAELKEMDRLGKLHDDIAERKRGRKIRIFMDGVFDLMHYGHVNAFRLGRSLGHELVVGVNSSKTIMKCKDIPYVMTTEYLERLMKRHQIDYVVHGDDPVIVDGKDVYAHVKKMGRYLSIPRTEGVSTTDIVGRMLLCNSRTLARCRSDCAPCMNKLWFWRTPSSRFLKTSSILSQFRGGMRDPKPDDRVVYIDGDWDMMNARHIELLKKARKLGDYLIVGVHNDDVVASNSKSRGNFPIMDLHERVLSVMGCKYVGDVLIDAPWSIDREHIKALNLSAVARGSRYVDDEDEENNNEEEERYRVAKEMGIFFNPGSDSHPCVSPVHEVVKKIQDNRQRFRTKTIQLEAGERASVLRQEVRKDDKSMHPVLEGRTGSRSSEAVMAF
eukprot:jgi/Bigna1/73090/fgenesh1_pg.22_\